MTLLIQNARVIDARGRILMPAMFDAHVHFREPGQGAKETIASGSAAAINGGGEGVVEDVPANKHWSWGSRPLGSFAHRRLDTRKPRHYFRVT